MWHPHVVAINIKRTTHLSKKPILDLEFKLNLELPKRRKLPLPHREICSLVSVEQYESADFLTKSA